MLLGGLACAWNRIAYLELIADDDVQGDDSYDRGAEILGYFDPKVVL